jgi:hypothetical protein
MAKRHYQIFRSDLEEGEELGLEPSPWVVGGDASIPLEHWDALQDLAQDRGFVDPELWMRMSDLDEVYCELEELEEFEQGLMELQKMLRADMMVMLQRTSHCPEPLPGSEHARMIDAVLRVFELSDTETQSFIE